MRLPPGVNHIAIVLRVPTVLVYNFLSVRVTYRFSTVFFDLDALQCQWQMHYSALRALARPLLSR